MRRSLLKGSKVVIDRAPDILVKSYSPNQYIQYLTLIGTDVIIKEEVSGNILWSCVGEGTLDYWTQLPLSAQHVDIRITAKKLKKITFNSTISEVKYFRVNSKCDLSDCFANCGFLTSVSDLGVDNMNSASRLFYNCQELVSVEPFSIKSGASLSSAFYLCTKLTTCPVINIEVSSSLNNCFVASGLNNLTNISGKYLLATNIESIFTGSKLTEVSNLTFGNATNISLYNMPLVTSINNIVAPLATQLMFSGNPELLSITDITTINARTALFSGNAKLDIFSNIQLSSFGLITGNAMFSGNYAMTFVPPFNYSNITVATEMFANCERLENLGNLVINEVKNTDGMFSGCKTLTSIPPLDYSSVTSASNMFLGCTGLTGEVNLTLGAVLYGRSIFQGCNKITRGVVTFRLTNELFIDSIFSDCLLLETAEIIAIGTNSLKLYISSGFLNCGNLISASLPQNPILGNYRSTFENCLKLTGIPNGLGSVGDFRKTFYNCKALTSISNMTFDSILSSTYQDQVAIFSETFFGSGLTSVSNITFRAGVGPFGYITNLFYLGYIFSNCQNLSSVSNIKIIVAGVDISTYTIYQFFFDCPLLTSAIPITVEVETNHPEKIIRSRDTLYYKGIVNYNDDIPITAYNSLLEFNAIPTLKTVNLTLNCASKNGTVELAGFYNCPELESVVINNPNNYKISNMYVYNGSWGYYAEFLTGVPKLTNLVIPNLKTSLAVPASVVSVPVLENLISNVADNSGENNVGIVLEIIIGETRKSQISQAVIDGAIAKNWSIV